MSYFPPVSHMFHRQRKDLGSAYTQNDAKEQITTITHFAALFLLLGFIGSLSPFSHPTSKGSFSASALSSSDESLASSSQLKPFWDLILVIERIDIDLLPRRDVGAARVSCGRRIGTHSFSGSRAVSSVGELVSKDSASTAAIARRYRGILFGISRNLQKLYTRRQTIFKGYVRSPTLSPNNH
jgi:hypothetical protein